MQSDKRHRKWASKSRIGAYIRGEIQLEDIMHPSKIIKPRERHNRRSRAFAEACCPTLLPASQPLVVRKDVQSKIRPYIRGLKSLRDLVHPSKLTTRVLGPHHFPAFVQLVQGGPVLAYKSGPESPQPDLHRLLAVLEGASNDQRTQHCVTVLVRDETDDGQDRVVSLILDDAESQSLEDGGHNRVVSLILGDTELQSPDDGQDRVVSRILGNDEPHNPELTRYFFQALAYPAHTSPRRSTNHSPIIITSWPDEPEASKTPGTRVADPPSQELVTQLYQKIQTLLEERVQTLAYSQGQFEKLETLQKENFQLRTTIAKIGEKLKDIEAGTDTLGSHQNDLTDQEKLKAQNQRLLKTMDTMSSYLGNFEEDRVGGATAEDMVDRYKHLYEKEVKNFKRHKRKCEAQHRQLLQRCGQLNQRLQELDSQNLKMAAKLSYVPVKIQLACRQYQDIIKKLNDDLDSLRSLERRSKSSTFAHEKSYPKSYTWF